MNTRILSSRSARAAAGMVMAAALVLGTSACSADDSGADVAAEVAFTGSHVDAPAFAAVVAEPGVVVIDVRTPEEFAAGHLPGAINVDVSAPDFSAQVSQLDPAAEYAVYCRSGNRSRAAIDQMSALGLTSTVGLEGGIGAWTGEVVTP